MGWEQRPSLAHGTEPRHKTGSGVGHMVGAGGDGFECAGGEILVVRGSVPCCVNASKPPECEQGVLWGPTCCFLPSRGVCCRPHRVSEPHKPQLGFLAPRRPPGPIPPVSAQLPAMPRSVPQLPAPHERGESDHYLCLARTHSEYGIPEGRSSHPRCWLPPPHCSLGQENRAGQPILPLHPPATSLCHKDIY